MINPTKKYKNLTRKKKKREKAGLVRDFDCVHAMHRTNAKSKK
uniref:Uncharacterized protein n=1 Tax=Rhizophora mucronata TaxID=61149 RepID=A0A2P2JPV6_RHIMU